MKYKFSEQFYKSCQNCEKATKIAIVTNLVVLIKNSWNLSKDSAVAYTLPSPLPVKSKKWKKKIWEKHKNNNLLIDS